MVNLCFTYPHFCNAIAFFGSEIVVILNKTSIFAACYYNTRATSLIFNFVTMEATTFNLIDAINCAGIDNTIWGCSSGIESTKHHFGTIEDMAIERMFIYVYRDENNESFIPKTTPSLTIQLEEEWGSGSIDIYYI